MKKPIKEGDVMPAFSLLNQEGTSFDLQTVLGKKPMVIYFYPKDDTPGCTQEACSFRDMFTDFEEAGAVVIGISADTPEKHRAFAEKYRLPFVLLSDTRNRVRKLLGVPSDLLGWLPGRVTYVVDTDGVVRHIFNSQFKAQKHVSEAMRTLKSLPKAG
jgi:peroxiredoxin Q/BCP